MRPSANFSSLLVYAIVLLVLYKSVAKHLGAEWVLFSLVALLGLVHSVIAISNPATWVSHGRVVILSAGCWLAILLAMGVATGEARVAYTGLASLALFPWMWASVLRADGPVRLHDVLAVLVYATVVMAAFGIYQYHFDKELWVRPHSLYADDFTLSYNPQISARATSFIGSPQNLALLLVLALPFVGYFIRPRPLRWASIGTILYAGVLTGSGMFGAGLFAFGIYHLIRLGSRRWILGVAASWLTLVFAYATYVAVAVGSTAGEHPLRGMVTLGLDSHIPYYEEQVLSIDQDVSGFLLGHGLGHADRLVEGFAPSDWVANESHLLRVFYELGVVGLGLLLALFAIAFRTLRQVQDWPLAAPCCFALAMVVGNAMFAPAQSGFTGSFLGMLFVVFPLVGIRRQTADVPRRVRPLAVSRVAPGSLAEVADLNTRSA